MRMHKRGLLIVLSGPSGAGKGTILKDLMQRNKDVMLSVSATTREPRAGEVDGLHYYFISKGQFIQMVSKDEMLEYAEYCDNYYGTPRDTVERWLERGKDVILEIEVQGAAQIMKKCPDAVSIFIMPPTMKALEERLRHRDTEDEETIQTRLAIAKKELLQCVHYEYVVFNGLLDDAVEELDCILKAEKLRTPRMRKFIDEVLEQC